MSITQDTVGSLFGQSIVTLFDTSQEIDNSIYGNYYRAGNGNLYQNYGEEKENRGLIADSGAWDGQMDHYAEWIKAHPESDTSRYDYNLDNDTYYWDQRNIKEGKRLQEAEFAQLPWDEQLW